MQNSTTKITLRIGFFTKDDGKQKRIIFHYKGTDLIVYRIRLKTITVKAFDSQEANFQFLKTYADREWEKYFEYKIEKNILKVTFKIPVEAIDVETLKKNPDWYTRHDSIHFTAV